MIPLVLVSLLLAFAQVEPLVIPGERLVYEVRSARFGDMGRAEFNTATLDDGTIRLSFDFSARVLLFNVSDHTYSELDAHTLRSRRYVKRERSPIGSRDENVSIDHATSTWTSGGATKALGSENPLDELSIIYLIRNMTLTPGTDYVLVRHFDAARNPIRVRRVDAAADSVDIVEMIVPDARQKNGSTRLRFHLSRDVQRVPLRIESSMPMAGQVIMTLVPADL